ncbi:HNH endonuclease [Streptomyces sp. NPDC002564]|uniref:HNH endonuclease n=1 Tax=Streptomyces sp. NPDC002564 TaxID=3364649 RepID=UPI0036CDF662
MTTTKPMLHGLTAAALLALPALTLTPASAAPQAPAPQRMSLADAVKALPQAPESRQNHERTGATDRPDDQGCTTRAKVLIAESRTAPVIEGPCTVTSGTWYSYYDGRTVTDPRALAVSHTVPLAEAQDSGAWRWSAQRRHAYAHDLDAEAGLLAVTQESSRSKADQDPAQWLPPLADARCTYAAEWTGTKLRWGLSADRAEVTALAALAEGCGRQEVTYVQAPETPRT